MASPPRILMCPPDHYGIEYEINPWMSLKVGSDPARSREQWQGLRSSLVELGATIAQVDPVVGLPDLVFTANAGLVYRDRVILSRFRFGVRQKEEPYFLRWFQEHGLRVETLPEGLYFEGAGDALFCGETLFAGYRFRSDARSHLWIGDRLGVRVLPLELVDPRFYHLDTCFCPLAEGAALYYPGAFDDYGRAVLRAQIPELLEVSAEEAVSFSCNAVVVGRSVVLNEGAPKLARTLQDRGFSICPRPFSEFIKAGGSAKCLTLRLDGEEAAAWRRVAQASAATSSTVALPGAPA
jgi:N-dimethylarginine dimethylaminohydrolase